MLTQADTPARRIIVGIHRRTGRFREKNRAIASAKRATIAADERTIEGSAGEKARIRADQRQAKIKATLTINLPSVFTILILTI
jgi:hypothetical protein